MSEPSALAGRIHTYLEDVKTAAK